MDKRRDEQQATLLAQAAAKQRHRQQQREQHLTSPQRLHVQPQHGTYPLFEGQQPEHRGQVPLQLSGLHFGMALLCCKSLQAARTWCSSGSSLTDASHGQQQLLKHRWSMLSADQSMCLNCCDQPSATWQVTRRLRQAGQPACFDYIQWTICVVRAH